MSSFESCYLSLHQSGELAERAVRARQRESACDLCARYCRVDRSERHGACRTGTKARVASYGPHHGEEEPLRGWRGSGTIFFTWCNLRCQYCQNSDISQGPAGREIESDELAAIMLTLQESGCHNINFVSPSHVVAEILEALVIAAGHGLRIPLVYNTGGYDSPEALTLLDGVVDIYMPDMKYADRLVARRLSKIGNYPEVNKTAIREMHRQVGDLKQDSRGIAQRGLLIRHLVLPEGLAGTEEIVRFLAEEISTNTYLNLMDQYRPSFKAHEYPPLNRRLTSDEYREALKMAQEAGLTRLDERRRSIFLMR
ncbi:MAG: radical SAM protein [Anaerolineae bacterium SM23_ 63]|nr:MAG: radical SAM protein [Anaerolineae bacterium SM23_ 63]HEY46095.1 radical SAM protein [Anaerolineae bacterium]